MLDPIYTNDKLTVNDNEYQDKYKEDTSKIKSSDIIEQDEYPVLSEYLNNLEKILDKLTYLEAIDSIDVSYLKSFLTQYNDIILAYSDIRNKFGRPDTDSTLLLFNISEAKTPFGKCVRCIAEIEDRIKAITENLSSLKNMMYVNEKDPIKNISKRFDLTYFKSAVEKLKYLIKLLKSIKEKYNLPDKWDEKFINESMKKEKILRILDELIFAIIVGDQIRFNNNALLLYNIGVNVSELSKKITTEINLNGNNILNGYENRFKFLEMLYNSHIKQYIDEYEQLHI